MADYQADLLDVSQDVEDYAEDLTESILEAAEEAGSEEDFGQLIRSDLETVLDSFGIGFDYVDETIGQVSADDVEAVLDAQGITFDDMDFDRDDVREGGMRPDAVAGTCVTDYKAPGVLNNKSGRKSAKAQIVSYMVATAEKQNVNVTDTVGVVLDGNQFLFLHGDDLTQFERRPVNYNSTREFATLLVGHWAVLTADRLISDFGNNTHLSSQAVKALFESVRDGGEYSDKMFQEWTLLFEQVCGFEFDKKKGLIEDNYNITIDNKEEFRQALFALYTYYALIAKLLAAEFAYYHSDSRFVSFLMKLVGRSDEDLQTQLRWLEDGGVFKDAGVSNFLEAGLFSWYVTEWNDDVGGSIRGITERMRKYDPGKLRDDPQETRDLFKKLYQGLVPDELRNQLGEIFTPDWLAELTIEEAGYDGEGSFLDPTCGSGTFLVLAAREKRRWYESQYGEDLSDDQKADLAETLVNEIEGFDLNPLAVLAARTNLLIEIGDLLPHLSEDEELPVYLCDSVRPPSLKGQLTGSFYEVKEVPVSDGDEDEKIQIKVPEEIIDKNLVNEYFSLARECSGRGDSAEIFVERFDREFGIEDDRTRHALQESYSGVDELRQRDVDGVWWEVVKNRFRPQFAGTFDYVIGNPPWITLDALPSSYREDVLDEWDRRGILPEDSQQRRKAEHGLLFTQVSYEDYLASDGDDGTFEEGGVLSFILPITVQRGGAANKVRDYFANHSEVQSITDVSDLNPFDVTRNRPVIFSTRKDGETDFPVSCETWIGRKPDFDSNLPDVREQMTQFDFVAGPVTDSGGKWYSGPEQALSAFKKLYGQGRYTAHKGVDLQGGTGLFFVHLDESTCTVENTNQGGGNSRNWEQVSMRVEPDLIYPAMQGRHITRRFRYSVPEHMLLPYEADGDLLSEDELRFEYPDSYDFLYNDRRSLQPGDRRYYGRLLKEQDNKPNHACLTAGNPFTDHKFVYKNNSGGTYLDMAGAAVGPHGLMGTEKPVVFPHSLNYIDAESQDEAYYLAAMINSAPIRAMIRAHSVLNANPRAIGEINLPKFNPDDDTHTSLVDLSQQAHNSDDEDDLLQLENEMNSLVADVFDITDEELSTIEDYIEKTDV